MRFHTGGESADAQGLFIAAERVSKTNFSSWKIWFCLYPEEAPFG